MQPQTEFLQHIQLINETLIKLIYDLGPSWPSCFSFLFFFLFVFCFFYYYYNEVGKLNLGFRIVFKQYFVCVLFK